MSWWPRLRPDDRPHRQGGAPEWLRTSTEQGFDLSRRTRASIRARIVLKLTCPPRLESLVLDNSTMIGSPRPLSPVDLRARAASGRAATSLSGGQIFLPDNPLLREPLRIEHTKPR